MYYRIAELILASQINLPAFTPFKCKPAVPDVTFCMADETPADGKEVVSGNIVHRIQSDGWFCYFVGNSKEGLLISSDYTHLRFVSGKSFAVRKPESYIRLALECLLIRRGFVSLHAAAVELNGEAYAFTGPSGIGKSTRARSWINYLGARLISGDRPLIRVDTMELFGMPWDGKEQCFRNVRRKLKAICEVRRSDVCYVRKLNSIQSRQLLLQQSFLPMWDIETAFIQMNNIFRLASGGNILRVFGGISPQETKKINSIIQKESFLMEEADMKAKPNFILREVMDEYILMPINENIGEYGGAVLLNSVSAFVWKKMQSPVSRNDLLAAIMQEFDVDENTASADLDALLEKLDHLELIVKE